MSTTIRRLARLLFLGGTLLGAAGCVGSPSDTKDVNGGAPFDESSQNGLVNATVTLDAPKLVRGDNDFSIVLQSRADASADAPVLVSAEATMPAHGHSVTADSIALDGNAYRAGLNFFMGGVWQVELGVELGTRSDSVQFSLDVP